MRAICSAGLLRSSFCCSGTAGSISVFSGNDMGNDDQRFNGQAGTERRSDLCGRSDSSDSVLPACFRMDPALDLEWRKQPEKILVFFRSRIFLSAVRDRNGSVFKSAAVAADSAACLKM